MNREALPPMDLEQALATLRAAIGSASEGLPEEIFLFASSITPMVNVDLLIRDEAGRTLLSWRHDAFYGPGWHVPGGIVRFKESFATRIAAVAAGELGAVVHFGPEPLRIDQIVNPARNVRGHFVSLLYACTLASPPDEGRRFDPTAPRNGDWQWHSTCPDNLIAVHEIYRRYIGGPIAEVAAK